MNLDDVLSEPRRASLVDHQWWVEGLVKDGEPNYDPEEIMNNNNSKDDLEIHWGYGTIEPQFSDEEHKVPSGGVDRNLPPEAVGDANPVIIFARDMMNRGFMGKELQQRIVRKFDQPSIKMASEELRSLFKLEGIVGRIAVDTRGYDDPRKAISAFKNNPYKRFIKYVIAEARENDDYAWLPDARDNGMVVADSCGNAMDDFFTEADRPAFLRQQKLVPHCKHTMMPIYGGMGDIDDSEMDSTLIDIMNVTELPDSKKDEIVHNDKYASNVDKLQAVFRWLDRQANLTTQERYEVHVDASEFKIEHKDQEIEMIANMSTPELDIDPVNHCLQNHFELDSSHIAQSSLDVSIGGEMAHIGLAGQSTANPLDVRIDGYGSDISVGQKRAAQSPLHIQEREIDGIDFLDSSIAFTNVDTPDVTGFNHPLTIPVDGSAKHRGAFDIHEESNGQMDSLISFDDDSLDISDLDSPLEVSLDPMQAMDATIDVDVFGSEMEFGLLAEVAAQDVSLAQHEDPMFVGTDIELDESPKGRNILDVQMGNSMEW